MANSEHLAKIKEGVEAWNEWRAANPEKVPDLSRAKLLGAKLNFANLRMADLGGTDLRKADLGSADLCSANLKRAQLNGARLRWATLFHHKSSVQIVTDIEPTLGDKLCEANLRLTDLRTANLIGANPRGADMTRALTNWTIFGSNNLSDVKGLETVQHYGPSTIGIDTIYLSHGNIPLAFLRGAGVPDNFIEYMGSLTGKALEFYSCFISYSTKDQEFADRLYADLQNKGVRCWFAPHDIQAGKKIHEQIDEAIRRYERLLLILSTKSMNSKWVKTEIANARKREIAEKRRVLFPIRLVSLKKIQAWKFFYARIGEDLADEILEYHIPDFSCWKNHNSYQKAFQRLTDDLKTEDPKAA